MPRTRARARSACSRRVPSSRALHASAACQRRSRANEAQERRRRNAPEHFRRQRVLFPGAARRRLVFIFVGPPFAIVFRHDGLGTAGRNQAKNKSELRVYCQRNMSGVVTYRAASIIASS